MSIRLSTASVCALIYLLHWASGTTNGGKSRSVTDLGDSTAKSVENVAAGGSASAGGLVISDRPDKDDLIGNLDNNSRRGISDRETSSAALGHFTTDSPPSETLTEPDDHPSRVINSNNNQSLRGNSEITVTSCELTTERRLTVIKSGGFPSAYGSGVDCKYSVRRYSADVCSVTFLFNVFDLENSEGCQKDFLQVEDGEKLCGSKPTGFTRSVPFHHPEEEVTMWFHSDRGSRGGAGFMTTVVQRECPPPDCDRKYSDPSFEIRSPNFPEPYENRQLCDYTVLRSSPKVCRLRLEVISFDVESAEHCDADSVEIKGNKLCGNLPFGEIVSVDFTEPLVVLRFRSDHATTRDGFHFRGTQEETGCEAEAAKATSGVDDHAKLPPVDDERTTPVIGAKSSPNSLPLSTAAIVNATTEGGVDVVKSDAPLTTSSGDRENLTTTTTTGTTTTTTSLDVVSNFTKSDPPRSR